MPRTQLLAAVSIAALAASLAPAAALRLSNANRSTPAVAETETRACLDAFAAGGLPGATECKKQPESPAELEAARAQHTAIRSAPDGHIPAGANAAAIAQREAMLRKGQAPMNAKAWKPMGIGPLQSNDPGYGVSGLGWVELAGRITDFAYDPIRNRVYASLGNGGLFQSNNQGQSWFSIGNTLPMQVVGSVGYSSANRGTIIALTGDGSFGGSSMEGSGAYRSTNGGKTWQRAKGAPSDAFGFNVVVDPGNPKIVYLGTGAGLYRSDDAGASYRNVVLPTGACAGKSNRAKGCTFANMVTDVVVQVPGGSSAVKGGRVVAVVGWRGGKRANPDGSVQAPANGVYSSDSGKPGTFVREAAPGFAAQERIGRVELGAAIGPEQNHNYLYALVQDAVAMRGGVPAIDADDPTGTYSTMTVLEGVYVSPDFGKTWVKMADMSQFQAPTTGSSLALVFQALGNYGPGVQAWYNQWIQPDPTRQVGGVPTRLLLGLEEVWQNEDTHKPQTGPTSFKVIGRYFSGNTCLGLGGLPAYACPTQRDEVLDQTTTTHPDQHAGLFIPIEGGVVLLAGGDGGVYRQRAMGDEEFVNKKWGIGSNRGMDSSLMAYHATRAKDGTVVMGLQDNGTAKIADVYIKGKFVKQRQIMTKGGDGFFAGVDHNNSKVQYGEYVGGAIAGTKDGGKTWAEMSPPITHGQFSTPFAVDPADPQHVMIGGREIVETGSGPGTSADDWAKVYDLGTPGRRGDATAPEADSKDYNTLTAVDLHGANAYVGFCGVCGVLNTPRPFKNGIATNVGGAKRPARYQTSGWHIAAAKGLPNRYITSIQMDPARPSTVYVTLGGYQQRWVPPGSVDNAPGNANGGHLYKSVDAGKTFVNISANLPNTPTSWVALRGKHLVVGTDIGVFASDPRGNCGDARTKSCRNFQVLGKGMPYAQVSTIEVAPWDSNLITVATFGRGVWEYRFGPPVKTSAGGAKKRLPTPKFLGKQVAKFDFEADDQGWKAKSNQPTMTWKRASPGHESSSSWQLVPYADEGSASLISPRMSLPARSNVKLSYYIVQDTEPCCDGFGIDWSSDGYVWNQLKSKPGQNKDFPNFSQESVSFTAPAGGLFIRFRLTSDALVSSPPYLGAIIDDVLVQR